MGSEQGVTYCCFGRPYAVMAAMSARSLIMHNPSISVHIITNITDIEEIFPENENLTIQYLAINNSENRLVKTALINFSPFKKTLYLDSDTLILGPINDLWISLEYFDLAFLQKRVPYPNSEKGNIRIFGGSTPARLVPSWNGGVFMFKKNTRTFDFFNLWNESFQRIGCQYDQPALAEAILSCNCRVVSLEERWNYFDHPGRAYRRGQLAAKPKILHYTSRFSRNLRADLIQLDRVLDKVGVCGSPIEDFIRQECTHRDKKLGFFKNRVLSVKNNMLELLGIPNNFL